MSITNILGINVHTFKLNSLKGLFTISSKDFLPGVYSILAVKDDQILATSRIAIQQ